MLPKSILDSIIRRLISGTMKKGSPSDNLRFLFTLENFLYNLEGTESISYDNGIHTKHRHTRYHDFFINRIKRRDAVLDIGCGNGALAFDIAENAGATVLGIDKNKVNIETAGTQYPHDRVNYIHGDVLNAHFPGDGHLMI